MNQLKKQISQKEATTSKPLKNLLTFNGFTQLKKLLKGLVSLALIFIVSFFITALFENSSKAAMGNNDKEDKLKSELSYANNIKINSSEKLIKEVDTYMKSIAPNTKLDAKILVNLCDKYHMSLIFVLAQGIMESHLGTRGKAVMTNSVWNVGSFDDGKIYYSYKNVNESIEPYLKLLRNNYLIRISQQGDTIYKDIKNLIQDRGFVNSEGKRFATSAVYENSLRTMILKINMESSINLYQGIMDMPDKDLISLFSPIERDSVYLAKL